MNLVSKGGYLEPIVKTRERRIQVILFPGQKNSSGTNGLATGKQGSAIHPSNPTQNFMTLNEQLVALLNNIDRLAQPLGNTKLSSLTPSVIRSPKSNSLWNFFQNFS